MRPLAYARAERVADAVADAAVEGTTLLAGGTELLNWLRLGVVAPDRLLDVSRIPELARIAPLPDGGLRIGAAVTLHDAAADARVAEGWPVLREAIHLSASAQIRNRATLGGNLLQKTRCPYFRSEDPVACNRRAPGSGCSAHEGFNANHAIFGWSEACIATHPSDPAVALAALDARVVVAGPDGGRTIPVRDFHVLPTEAVADSVLAPGELIVALELPAPAPASAYVKVRERQSYEYALVSAGVALALDGGTIRHARVALGSVAMRPWRLDSAEQTLVGLAPDAPEVEVALEVALADARPLAQNGYKIPLARNAALRALRIAAGLEERVA
ncbi:Aldehyde oxidoreductase FAD-binding subunit PaoB [Baekduia alba]|uniref:FAD binding domain-containing protein n=1 Tax=Baekduia alba TaxID=2997333 RepID=UPI002341D05B|nr:FAD binding domain-containing protein [Baekduia alba]WCB96863.1 Aldehyde oxidoreductase FAD-binding subunit PaoB [Baekduia alba]